MTGRMDFANSGFPTGTTFASLTLNVISIELDTVSLSVESQKGVITVQQCSVENQKGAITVQSVYMAITPF